MLDICKKDLVRSLYELFKCGLINIVVWYDFLNSYYKFCYKNYVYSLIIVIKVLMIFIIYVLYFGYFL